MLDQRLKAYRHWLTMEEPHAWPMVKYPAIDYQAACYYSAPKPKKTSMDEVDPELLATYEKLGIPLAERAALAGVAVDAVFDSVSVATTFKEKLGEMGKPHTFDYKGREIKLCCKSCLKDFNKEPAKYIKKLDEKDAHKK